MSAAISDVNEWIEADGLGGFASGTVTGVRTRRYHGLLLHATDPPTGRLMLVNGVEAWAETGAGRFALSTQHYAPGVRHPDGQSRIESFAFTPWPTWIFHLEDGTRIEHEVFVRRGQPVTVATWRCVDPSADVKLFVRPLLSGRDYHALHHENPAFRFEAREAPGRLTWHPYDGVPPVECLHNGKYAHEPTWYRQFQYAQERDRGLDDLEDLASPGTLSWDLSAGVACLVLRPESAASAAPAGSVLTSVLELRHEEREYRDGFDSPEQHAADAYVVRRGRGRTLIAGYPWFTDWGRDTFIAIRGLCLATGRLDTAKEILLEWAGAVSEGMLPNRFPDAGSTPEYNSVDASLWYIVAVHELLEACRRRQEEVSAADRGKLLAAIDAILRGYSSGTRFGIRQDTDGLLAAGVPGVQLTWMDAKVGDWVVTPRVGKPVEVQALWLNALWCGSQYDERWTPQFERGRDAFRSKFWCEERGYLYDVVDVDHQPGRVDPTLRPNQILAIGGLPQCVLGQEAAQRVVDLVEARLMTPLGPRSLASGEAGYVPHYAGGVRERDGAYHQGTVWPWLIGPFVEAWLRVRGCTPEARAEARRRFLGPVRAHLDEAGLGHVSEIADAEPPFTPRGCPFQAWSLGELLRLELSVLAEG